MTRFSKLLVPILAGGVMILAAPGPAAAALLDGYKGTLALTAADTAFSEDMAGTTNPSTTYVNVRTYGPLTVSFGPYFTGQSYSFDMNTQPVPTQTGDRATGPLSLATSDPSLSAIIEDDNPNAPNNPVVGGSIGGSFSFVGPIAILFSTPVPAVELTVGEFGEAGQTILEAFAANGLSLGMLRNGVAGYQQFDLYSDLGSIAGLSLRSADNQSPTFIGVSGLGLFEDPAAVPPTPPTAIPAPGSTTLVLAAGAVVWFRHRRRPRHLLK